MNKIIKLDKESPFKVVEIDTNKKYMMVCSNDEDAVFMREALSSWIDKNGVHYDKTFMIISERNVKLVEVDSDLALDLN